MLRQSLALKSASFIKFSFMKGAGEKLTARAPFEHVALSICSLHPAARLASTRSAARSKSANAISAITICCAKSCHVTPDSADLRVCLSIQRSSSQESSVLFSPLLYPSRKSLLSTSDFSTSSGKFLTSSTAAAASMLAVPPIRSPSSSGFVRLSIRVSRTNMEARFPIFSSLKYLSPT